MIRFHGLVKKFGKKIVLNGLSFAAKEGEIIFVLGTSGTGKSVLLKSLVGLLKLDAGQIYIDGEEVSQFNEEQYLPMRKKCGMVFQQAALFDSLNVYENVAFGIRRQLKCDEAEVSSRVTRALHLVHLHDIELKMPAQLSYGMQKRVSLARTIALEPKILLFDEPTTGLDPVTTNAINQLILELSRTLKTTSMVVSHDIHCALDIADRILVLSGGVIVEQGTPDQLRRSKVSIVREFLSEVIEQEVSS